MGSGLFMLSLAAIFWFGMAKDTPDKSSTGFVSMWKAVFGIKGYVVTVRILALFAFFAAISEFYKYFME